ncbi:hypothetical protein ACWDBW_06640 [Streptomyces sp. NPDC001107]
MQRYLAAGLIDELPLHVVPALLEDALRLSEGLGAVRRKPEPVRVVDTPTRPSPPT